MSAENWMQRASGLVVPAMGFANHPLGMFQACAGSCCFDPVDCTDCGNSLIDGVWIDLPVLGNGGCISCADYAGSYFIGDTPTWCRVVSPLSSPPCSLLDFIIVRYCVIDGKCFLAASLQRGFGFDYPLFWALELTSFADPIDHILPYASPGETHCWDAASSTTARCSGVGTTVHVYE